MPLLPKFLRSLRYRIFYGLFLSKNHRLETLGAPTSICKWTICPDGLNEKSIIYSGGVGTDITFERALVEKYGCKVVLLDPSPTGVKTMQRDENKIPQYEFLPMALTAQSGKRKMSLPHDGADSWFASDAGVGTVDMPSTNVASLMQRYGHDHVDFLKLDIEGCEYEVIDDVLEQKIPVRQIAADFDYGHVPGVRRSQAIRAMLKLRMNGYKLICQDGANHTFVKP